MSLIEELFAVCSALASTCGALNRRTEAVSSLVGVGADAGTLRGNRNLEGFRKPTQRGQARGPALKVVLFSRSLQRGSGRRESAEDLPATALSRRPRGRRGDGISAAASVGSRRRGDRRRQPHGSAAGDAGGRDPSARQRRDCALSASVLATPFAT